MTKNEWTNLANKLKKAYVRYEKFMQNQSDVVFWYGYLQNLEYPLAVKAVDDYIMESEFPPTIADIVKRHDEEWKERHNKRQLVLQEMECFEYKFPNGYNGKRRECEEEFARLTLYKAANEDMALKYAKELRCIAEDYLSNGGNMNLLDWLKVMP